MDLTPKQQTSEAIRQAETILVTTAQHPSVDQVAAVIGLTMILRKFGKKVTAAVSDSLPTPVQLLESSVIDRGLSGMRDFVLKLDVSKAEVDKLRYEVIDNKLNIFITPFKGGFAPSDVTFDYGSFQYDLVIVLGVPTRARLDRIFEVNAATFADIPLVNLDFHRSNENYGAVNLIEPNASSLCEVLVALAESLQSGLLDEQIATAFLMGIVASTDRFTATHTTSKSLTVAAQMMAAGARQQAVVKALYRDGKPAGERSGERGGERGGGGNDRGNDRGSDRGTDRGDRGPRDNRPSQPAREQRPDSRGERQGSAPREPQPERVSERAPQPPREDPVQEAPASDGASAARPEPVSEPENREQPALPELESRPQRDAAQRQPIIDPGHIELSDPDEAPEQLTQEPEADVPPMADFAAAAEILARRQDDDQADAQ